VCGIAGIFQFNGDRVDPELLREMTALLKHRGPDGEGFYIGNDVGIGHRRLKIIDLSENGKQPMSNEDKTVWVSCNGEIYNYKKLTSELKSKGHFFRSRSDSEVIVHSYEEWGIRCIERFHGMFAFVLYDCRAKKMFLVRDRLGIKPLFYYTGKNRLLFSSEIKAILVDPDVPREMDKKCLHNYLSLNYVTAPLTLFKNIFQILPGHYLQAEKGGCNVKRYWDVTFEESKDNSWNQGLWLEEFDHRLYQSVKSMLVGDVPFGAFLSGGLDSSSVVHYMSQIMKTRVKTFSVGFEEKLFDELSDAELVAKNLGTIHSCQIVKSTIDEAFIKKMVWHSEEPTADSSIIPMYLLARMASEEVKMVLSGDGADEILAGYETYLAYYLRSIYRFIPGFIRTSLIRKIVESLPISMGGVSPDYKLKAFVRGAEYPWQEAHYYWRIIFDENEKSMLYAPSFREEVGAYKTFDVISPFFGKPANTPLNAMLEADTKFYLPNDMLVKVDRASMAHSLEVRVPFLDHKLVEFVAGMPERLKLHWFFQRKFALRSVMRGRLPRSILRKRKLGFNVPINIWLKGSLREFMLDTLSPQALRRTGIFDPGPVSWVIGQHLKGKRDFGYQIWSLLVLLVWWKTFIDLRD